MTCCIEIVNPQSLFSSVEFPGRSLSRKRSKSNFCTALAVCVADSGYTVAIIVICDTIAGDWAGAGGSWRRLDPRVSATRRQGKFFDKIGYQSQLNIIYIMRCCIELLEVNITYIIRCCFVHIYSTKV